MSSNFSGKQINSLRNVSGRFFSVFSGKPHNFTPAAVQERQRTSERGRCEALAHTQSNALRPLVFRFARSSRPAACHKSSVCSCFIFCGCWPPASLRLPLWPNQRHQAIKVLVSFTNTMSLWCAAVWCARAGSQTTSAGFWPKPQFDRPLACTNARSVRAQTLDVTYAYFC